MASLNIAQALLASYPEANPFDADPPPYNLTPYSRETELHWDTPEFVAAALDISERSGNNPLRHMYGTNPMVLTDYRARNLNLPLSAYTPPPPLQKTSLPSDATFLERIHPHCHEVLVTIRVDGEVRLLKIFADDDPEEEPNWAKMKFPNDDSVPSVVVLTRFEQERDAYAHLVHGGVCDKGIVPKCFGWLTLTDKHIEQFAALPNQEQDARVMRACEPRPYAILLEYLPDAEQMDTTNVTEKLADIAMRGLYDLHAAYVLHCDVHRRNILVLPGDRVVWVDFNNAKVPSGKLTFRRQEFMYEMELAWTRFYEELLPDRRIGFRQWVGEWDN